MLRRLIGSVETCLSRSFERPFIRALPSPIHEIEVRKKLEHSMELHISYTAGQVIAPNVFEVRLGVEDYRRFAGYRRTLQGRLQSNLFDFARTRGYTLPASPIVVLTQDRRLRVGAVDIAARFAEGQALAEIASAESRQEMRDRTETSEHQPAIARRTGRDQMPRAHVIVDPTEAAPRSVWLDKPTIHIGRHRGNEIRLADPEVSRHHSVIRYEERGFVLYDLGSLLGIRINGTQAETAITLREGDHIAIGEHELVFHSEPIG